MEDANDNIYRRVLQLTFAEAELERMQLLCDRNNQGRLTA